MIGEELNAAEVTNRGLLGDRASALLDTSDGKVASAKNPRKWPQLFDFRAALADAPSNDTSLQSVHVTLPDSTIIASDQPDIDQILKIQNHAAMVAVHSMYYNFGRIHKTLRITPAMAAGRADHVWSLEEIALLAN